MRIQRLSSIVANQIAAGEVIERPASVVKELLENALDAGASQINIELGFGGLNLIKISDNGHGICAEDLPLAIEAHATSKITTLNDLSHTTTMGFRGEALASMASVSRLTISSKPAEQDHGMSLSIEDTKVQILPLARNQGTTIEVRDLFFNTPVRKAFLKSEKLEYQAIELVVKQFALSAPHIAVILKHNSKQMLNLPKALCEQSRLRRLKKIFGQAFLTDAIYIDETYEHIAIQGWVSHKGYQRSQRDRQWIYLNHRLIKDKLIQQVIGQAYQDILHPGRFSSCVLYLSIAPDQVDVNVHPSKHEVRFLQARLIHATLVSTFVNHLSPHNALSYKSLDTNMMPFFLPNSTPIMPQSFSNTSVDIARTWMVINPHFLIIKIAMQAYLVNFFKVHQYYITQEIQKQTHPLAHRVLLVPVRVDIERTAYALFEYYQICLPLLGIHFDFLSETALMIRTIPLSLPLLDLSLFFSKIKNSNYDNNAIISHAIASQSFDAYNISSNERETLLAYCLQNWDGLKFAYLKLDFEQCQTWLREN